MRNVIILHLENSFWIPQSFFQNMYFPIEEEKNVA